MNLENYNLDQVEIVTNRATKSSIVSVIFSFDSITIRASKACFRSLESELETQGEVLESLGFSDKQIRTLSYE